MSFLKYQKIILFVLIIGFISLFDPSLSFSQSHSLSYFITRAYRNDPNIATSQRNIKIANLNKQINTDMFRKPVLSGNGFALWAPATKQWGFDKAITNGGEYDALLNLSYPLWQGNDLKAHNMVSNSQMEQAGYNLKFKKHNLKMQVTRDYIQVYGDQQNIRYLKNLHDLLKGQINQWSALVKSGLMKITDLQQVRLEDSQILIQMKQARNQLKQDESTINQLCGLTDTTQYSVAQPALKSSVLSDSLFHIKNSRFLKSFSIDSLSIEAQQKVKDTKYLPQVNAMVNTGLSSSDLGHTYHNLGFDVGLQLHWRLWDGGQKSIQHQKTQLNLQNVQDQKYFEKKRLLQQRNSLVVSLKSVQSQIREQKKQVQNYRSLIKAYRIEIGKGIRSVTAYVTVFRQYLNARNTLNNLDIQRLQTINELNYWNW